MTFTRIRLRGLGLATAALLALAGIASAATITIVNNDGVGEGFNDPAARAPVGGNPAVTLGGQRLFVFQEAANIWGALLPSAVVIEVRAQFNPQTCTPTSAVLGAAGPVTIHRDFTNAPFPATWYHQALANRLAGVDLSAANPDINATFNLNLDSGTCLGGLVWYYGIDGNEGANIELLPVVLHELGHGLGFSTTTSGTNGGFNGGFPHIYDRYLMDNTLGLHWYQMTAAQRVASAISVDKLVWDGPATIAAAATFLNKRPQLVVNSPGGIAGTYAVMAAAFGPPIPAAGITGDVVLVSDGTVPDADACEPIVNSVFGKIALIERGTCTFVSKVLNAQALGAIAVLIYNNAAGLPPMGGSDPTVTIPSAGISTADGNAIIANLGGGVNVTLNLHPTLLAGADSNGKPLMYAPNPFQGGSSVSHWDVTHSPNTLMEPAINTNLHNTVDLTLQHFTDIGWFQSSVATYLEEFTVEGRGDGVLLRWRFHDPSDVTAVSVERATAVDGPWSPAVVDVRVEGQTTSALDAGAEAGVTYYYRLLVTDRNGEVAVSGLVSGQRATSDLGRRVYLAAPTPNPAIEGTAVMFRLSRPEYVRLTIHDVSGRTVRTLQDGEMLAGEYTKQWDGRTDSRSAVPAGVYFVQLRTHSGMKSQRVTVMR
jgi:hypothetical protein